MKRGVSSVLATLLAGGLVACGGGGLSAGDKALCKRLDTMNVFMDTQGVGFDDTSAKSVFTALEGAENEKLAQVGRDYLNAGADPLTADDYKGRADAICAG